MKETAIHILMIEDVARYHVLFGAEITDALNAEVDFVESGELGLQKLQADPSHYDLLLLDLNLPGISGEEVIKKIRSERSLDALLVIVLTGSSSAEAESRLLGMGANEFIEKGCTPELFIARLKAQCRTKMALDKAMQLALDRDMFAAGVLHDLRNIESNLLATCDLIEMQVKAEPIKNKDILIKDVENLKVQVRRMDDYATHIIGQIRETQAAPQIKDVFFQDILLWVVDFLHLEQTKKKLSLDVPDNLRSVKADANMLRLVLLNILQNSVKYARPGIDACVHISQETAGKNLITRLTDNGIGVAEADLRLIFQPFYRGSDLDAHASGFGLGLSMVAKVVGKMHGRVWAEKPKGQDFGTTICLELPASK